MASPKPKRKPAKSKSKLLKKPQSERFRDTALALGAKSRTAFERVFSAIAPPKRAVKRQRTKQG